MKITAISDLHGYLPGDLPGGDVLCICGDIVPLEYQSDFNSSALWYAYTFGKWVSIQPYRKVVFIGGNHDFFLEELGEHEPATWMTRLSAPPEGLDKLVYLCDSSIEIDGVTFYGTPWIADLSRWAFYKNENELKKIYGRIPQCDVLLTHMPPLACEVGRVLQRGCYNTFAEYGSQALADAIRTRDISYALCGHVHSGNHCPQRWGSVMNLVNVSLKDENYKVAYEPFNFEI